MSKNYQSVVIFPFLITSGTLLQILHMFGLLWKCNTWMVNAVNCLQTCWPLDLKHWTVDKTKYSIYQVSQKFKTLLEASYLQNFNAWWKFENIFRKKKLGNYFDTKCIGYNCLQWELTCKRNHIYKTALSYKVVNYMFTSTFQLRYRFTFKHPMVIIFSLSSSFV